MCILKIVTKIEHANNQNRSQEGVVGWQLTLVTILFSIFEKPGFYIYILLKIFLEKEISN